MYDSFQTKTLFRSNWMLCVVDIFKLILFLCHTIWYNTACCHVQPCKTVEGVVDPKVWFGPKPRVMCWTHTRKHASSWLLFACLAFPCVFAQVNVRQWHTIWCFLERTLFPYYAIWRFLRLILVLKRQHRWRRLQVAQACRWHQAETAGVIGCRWLISRYRMLHDACTTTVSCPCNDNYVCFIDSL